MMVYVVSNTVHCQGAQDAADIIQSPNVAMAQTNGPPGLAQITAKLLVRNGGPPKRLLKKSEKQ